MAVVIATVRGGAGNPLLLTGAAAHEPRVPALVNRGSGSGRQPGHDQRLELHCPTGLGGRERLEPGRPGVLVGHPGLHDETSSAVKVGLGGFVAPCLLSKQPVTVASKERHRVENKQ